MKNFDWKEFLTDTVGVHCDTEEKANDFLKEANRRGFKWIAWGKEESLLNNNYWNRYYKAETCYILSGASRPVMVVAYRHLKKTNSQIIEWEIDEMKEFTKEDLKVGMLVENDLAQKLGNAMVMPTETGLFLAYKNGACGNIDFSTITKVWGYPTFFYEARDFSENHRKLLYEKVKKMTVKEICNKLGYKVEIVEG